MALADDVSKKITPQNVRVHSEARAGAFGSRVVSSDPNEFAHRRDSREMERDMLSKFKMPLVLSGAIAALALVASIGPLYFDLYRRDVPFAAGAQHGTDLVTLFLATPLLLLGMLAALRGSARGRLIWIGMLEYMLYNFLFYLLGAAMNEFFPVYVGLCVLSMYALIALMNRGDMAAIGALFRAKAPARRVSIFLMSFFILLVGMWITQWYRVTFTGATETGLPPEAQHLISAVDLTLFAPAMLVIAILLWRRTPLGYAHATAAMIMASVYPLVLIASAPFQAQLGVQGAWTGVPLWAFLSAGSFICSIALLMNVQRPDRAR